MKCLLFINIIKLLFHFSDLQRNFYSLQIKKKITNVVNSKFCKEIFSSRFFISSKELIMYCIFLLETLRIFEFFNSIPFLKSFCKSLFDFLRFFLCDSSLDLQTSVVNKLFSSISKERLFTFLGYCRKKPFIILI